MVQIRKVRTHHFAGCLAGGYNAPCPPFTALPGANLNLLEIAQVLQKTVMIRGYDGPVDMDDHGASCFGPMPEGLCSAAQVLMDQNDNTNRRRSHSQCPFDIRPKVSSCCQPVNFSDPSHHRSGLWRSAWA